MTRPHFAVELRSVVACVSPFGFESIRRTFLRRVATDANTPYQRLRGVARNVATLACGRFNSQSQSPSAGPESAWSQALAVDAFGETVVGKASSSSGSSAFIWQDVTGIQPLADEDAATVANSISADGTVIVGRAASPSTSGEAFRWAESQGFALLGNIVPTTVGSEAIDVSADGSAIVGVTSSTSALFEGFLWTTENGFQPLGDLSGGSYMSVALAVSPDGGAIVGQSESANGPEAFRWTAAEGMVGLGDLPGGHFYSMAHDVSGDGEVIVGAGESDTQLEEAFRWDKTTGLMALGHLAETYPRSIALAVTSDGTTVVGVSGLIPDDLTAFIWDRYHGMRSLQQLLMADSTLTGDLTGWRLATAHNISADGRAIVGWGYNPDGHIEAWLVRLDRSLAAPEPSSLSLLLLAALALGRTRRC
jgi:probable HAF family extracellular repeat protein